jgi:acetyl-CoA acetyltransferase
VREVFLVGVGATGFGEVAEACSPLVVAAATAALADAGLSRHDLGAVTCGGRLTACPELDVALGGPGRMRRPSAWAGRALQRAWQAVAAGDHDIVLCVGAAGTEAACHALPTQAEAARRVMARSDATPQHLAQIVVKNRAAGARNPHVAGRKSVDLDAVLASETVAWPLRRLMVAPPACGAAAVVLASQAGLRNVSGPEVRVRAAVLASAADGELAATRAARLAYQEARLGPEDLDCAEVDDRTAATELVAYETLQFVPVGQGPELVESGFTAAGGVLPVNTSGGLLSQGDATGASGLAQLCELTWQLRGQADARQVAGASAGLALSGFEKGDGGPSLVSLLIIST